LTDNNDNVNVNELSKREKILYHIIRKLTANPESKQVIYYGFDFTKLEIRTLIKLMSDYIWDEDILVDMGSYEVFVKGEWVWKKSSDHYEEIYNTLPDEAYLSLKPSDERAYYNRDCHEVGELWAYFENYITDKH